MEPPTGYRRPSCLNILLNVECSLLATLLLCFLDGTTIITRTAAEPTLVQAQILFRHGMRAPDEPYPTDPYQNEYLYWPNGWGQLTNYGKEQQYLLGKFLRTRYTELLSDVYHADELYVVSTDYDRTIISAGLALAGLYPNGEEMWNEYLYSRLDVQQIPIHTISDGQNRLMLHHSYIQLPDVCPRYFEFFHQEMMEHPDIKVAMETNADLIDLIQNRTGLPAGVDLPLLYLFGGVMMGTLYVEQWHGLEIPEWAVEVLANPANLELFGESFAYMTITDEAKRLAGGPLLKEWIQHMKEPSKFKKLYIYSAHDLNVVTMLNTMGLFEQQPHIPEMGSVLFVELYQDQEQDDQFTVQVHYRLGLSFEMVQLKVPGCTEPCTLDSLERTLAKYLPDDLDEECKTGSMPDSAAPSAKARTMLLYAIFITAFYLFIG